jgi:hypothetical protein
MIRLQHKWYNCLIEALSLDPSMFQIVVPSAPMMPTDDALWDYLNTVPSASLTFNRSATSTDRLFDQYAAMVSQTEFSQRTFEQIIGRQNFQAWSAYLASQHPPPADNQLPALFQNWAARNNMSIAAAGVAFLSRCILVAAMRQALVPYQGEHAKPADFMGSYADALHTLGASGGCKFFFDSRDSSADVSDAWAADHSADELWAGSGDGTSLSRKFATSNVTVSAEFAAYAQWTAAPGPWYSSALFGMLYGSQATPPWRADAKPSWSDLFGPDGSLCRLVASLLLADGGNITVTSDATFGPIDRRTIVDYAPLGLWPCYAASGGGVSNAVTFSQGGRMAIEIVTPPGHPVVIGENVLGTARYLGQATS